jgi:hypothetical protein
MSKASYITELLSKCNNIPTDVNEAMDEVINLLEHEIINQTETVSFTEDVMNELFMGIHDHNVSLAKGSN